MELLQFVFIQQIDIPLKRDGESAEKTRPMRRTLALKSGAENIGGATQT